MADGICSRCTKQQKKIANLTLKIDELNHLVEQLNNELTDKVELIEYIKEEFRDAYYDDQKIKTMFYRLYARIIK